MFIIFIIIIKVSNGLQCVMQYWVHVSDETNGEQKHYCLTIIKINACYCFSDSSNHLFITFSMYSLKLLTMLVITHKKQTLVKLRDNSMIQFTSVVYKA